MDKENNEIESAYEKAKVQFIFDASRYLDRFMPLSDEDEENDLLAVLGKLGAEYRRKG